MADDPKVIVQRMIDAGESEENIATVIRHFQNTSSQATSLSVPQGSTPQAAIAAMKDYNAKQEPAQPSALDNAATIGKTVGSDLWHMVTGALSSVYEKAAQGKDPIQAVAETTITDPAIAAFKKGLDAWKQGRYSEALGHAAAGAIPVAGPLAEQIGELIPQTQTGSQEQRMKAAGHILTVIGSAAAPEALLRLLPKSAQITPALRNPNPVEAAAADFGASRGITVDAGTATGNPAIKGVQFLADRSLGGSIVSTPARAAQADALASTGRSMAAEANGPAGPPMTPVTAGESVRGAIDTRVTDLHAEANAAYGKLRALEPANTVSVQTGTKASASGLVKDQPVFEDIAFPVNLKGVKAALKPLYDRMRRQMPVTQQQASPGLKALENIVTGPDVAPATTVDLDLSAIKEIARQADRPEVRDLGQGLAAGAVKQLDNAVQSAIARGGPDAIDALKEGRASTRAKFLANDVLDSLREEPRRAFDQATTPKDASIAQLRQLQQLAPEELRHVGRAYLEDLLDTATKEGGFGKSSTIATRWQNLGPQTKAILFGKTPGLVPELDKFFTLARKVSESPNPSGTSGIVSIGSQGVLLAAAPHVAVPLQIGAAVLAKMLRNPTAVRALTEGLRLPVRATGYRAAVAARIAKAAQAAEQQDSK